MFNTRVVEVTIHTEGKDDHKTLGLMFGDYPPEGGNIVGMKDLFSAVLQELYGDTYKLNITKKEE